MLLVAAKSRNAKLQFAFSDIDFWEAVNYNLRLIDPNAWVVKKLNARRCKVEEISVVVLSKDGAETQLGTFNVSRGVKKAPRNRVRVNGAQLINAKGKVGFEIVRKEGNTLFVEQ